MTRYEALLKVCDMACAYAAKTHTDNRPEFFDALALALEDDCPKQSEAAAHTADSLRTALHAKGALLKLLSSAEDATDGTAKG